MIRDKIAAKRIANGEAGMRIEHEATLQKFRGPGCCALCRRPKLNLDPHHVRTRGNNGSDFDFNLVSLCRRCHDGRATTEEGDLACREIIAKRLGCTAQEIWDANNFVAEFLDKHDSEAKIAEKLADLTPSVFRLVEGALLASGKLAPAKGETT